MSNEAQMSGFTHKVEFDFTDLTPAGAALTTTIALGGVMPAGTVILNHALKVVTAGAGTTTLTAQLGDSGVADRFVTAALGLLMAAAGTIAAIFPGTAPAQVQGTRILQMLVTSSGTNLDALTAGSWVWYLRIAALDKL